MVMKISIKSKMFLIISLFLTGCGSSAVENESIRASNCALIADWNVYSNDPSTDYYQGNLNSYETESLIEDILWRKLQTGDKSYEAMVELRKLRYNNNFWNAPPMGEKVTIENVDAYRAGEDMFDDETSWKIIENVRASCPAFSKELLAELFSPVLNM
jgi:pullulanase/glycogen debranching enzyme